MEQSLKIKTTDGHTIYGTLRKATGRSRGLIIFVHGLGGHKNEHQFFNGARFFAKHGFDTFRFDLYSGEKGGRTLTQCTISTHAQDLDTVVEYFRKSYNRIFAVGHSLGSPAILLSHTDKLAGIVLWDPAKISRANPFSWLRYHHTLKTYIINWGTEILMNKKMVEEWHRLSSSLIDKIQPPMIALMAGHGVLLKPWKKYIQGAKRHVSCKIIFGAGHTFDEDGAEEKLFAATLAFLKKL